VIQYRNQKGKAVSEVLRFADGKVIEGQGTYAAEAPVDVGLTNAPPA